MATPMAVRLLDTEGTMYGWAAFPVLPGRGSVVQLTGLAGVLRIEELRFYQGTIPDLPILRRDGVLPGWTRWMADAICTFEAA